MRDWLSKRPPRQQVVDLNHEWIIEGRQIHGVEPVLQRLLVTGDAASDPVVVSEALIFLGTRDSVPALIEGLSHSEDWVQIHCAMALARLKAEEALPALARCLDSSPSGVRMNVAWAIGEIGDDFARRDLAEALRKEEIVIGSIREAISRIEEREGPMSIRQEAAQPGGGI